MVDENVAPSENFQVCLRLLDGTLLATQSVRLEIVLTQGAGDAVCELINKLLISC